MLISLNWLKEFVKIDNDIKQFTERMTMSGSNVEGVKEYGKEIKNVFIGKILEVEKHPNADKLLITKVDVGNQKLQIITGAENIKVGDKVPVAVHGATLVEGVKIKRSKLRGLESEGMLCSAEELGIDDHGLPENVKNGILILSSDAPLGEDIKNYIDLEDLVIDFEITPNRPDCLNVMGIAREVSATYDIEFKDIKISLKEKGKLASKDCVKVSILDKDLCKRYTARVVEDVKLGPSPMWMQRRLQVCGVRPINNIVDITNYVMLELGQPLHAFDFDKISGNTINVRKAKAGEELVTLDGITRKLSEDMLVIADDENPVALAGVMGGSTSEVSTKTRTLLLESANFNGPSVRRTSRRLGLRSEASMRFEKGLDPMLCEKAINRACQLIEELEIGKVSKGMVDVCSEKFFPKKVTFSPKNINRILGTKIDFAKMKNMLKRLEIEVEENDGEFFALVPTFRGDIKHEADLAEEVGRIYGYNRLPSSLPEGDITIGKLNQNQKLEEKLRQSLINSGYSEIYNYSITSPKSLDNINTPMRDFTRNTIKIKNPLGEEHSILRTSLIPSMLNTIQYNLNQGIDNVRLFEIGKIYLPKKLPLKELPNEVKKLSIGMSGKNLDFYDIKNTLEVLFTNLKVKKYTFKQSKHFAFHLGRCAKIFLDGSELGYVGEIHPDVLENYEIDRRVYLADIDIKTLFANTVDKISFKPLPKFPSSHRDLAIVVKDDILAGDIIDSIKKIGGDILEKVEIFDIYRGEQILPNHKSIAFSLKYRAGDRTLKEQEINEVQAKIINTLSEKFEGKLRE